MSESVASVLPGQRIMRLSGVRRFIADRMMESLSGAAQLSFHADADVTHLLALRLGWKQAGLPISIEDCLIRSFARALAAQPDLNGIADATSVTLFDTINVAIAVAAPDGLKTPVLRDVAAMSLLQIAEARRDLVGRARERKLQVSEMKGATTTVSNLGSTRVRYFTPILNAGQLVLLGVGCVTPHLALDATGGIVEKKFMGLSVTVDHRIVDGEPAGRLLTHICSELESFDPET